MFRVLESLRSRLVLAVKLCKSSRVDATLNLLGCTTAKLKHHIESQFRKGMNWGNYGIGSGKWHIDHIAPCASFDLSNPEAQRICFHYLNLKPLWGIDNLRKGART
jgi:hypothetical protein